MYCKDLPSSTIHATSSLVWGMDSSLETKMPCMGHHEIKHPMYKNFMKKNICMCTKNILKDELMYLYQVIQFNMMNASTTYTNYTS